MPQSFAMLVKTLIVLEGTGKQLSPGFSLAAIIRPYYLKAVRRRFAPGRVAAGLGRNFRDWKRLLEDLPRDLSDILSRFRKGTLEVHMEHRRLESTVDRLVLGLLSRRPFSVLQSSGVPKPLRACSESPSSGDRILHQRLARGGPGLVHPPGGQSPETTLKDNHLATTLTETHSPSDARTPMEPTLPRRGFPVVDESPSRGCGRLFSPSPPAGRKCSPSACAA